MGISGGGLFLPFLEVAHAPQGGVVVLGLAAYVCVFAPADKVAVMVAVKKLLVCGGLEFHALYISAALSLVAAPVVRGVAGGGEY